MWFNCIERLKPLKSRSVGHVEHTRVPAPAPWAQPKTVVAQLLQVPVCSEMEHVKEQYSFVRALVRACSFPWLQVGTSDML